MISPREIETILDNITLIYDTREHETKSLQKRLEATGMKYRRECLKFGDYTAEYIRNGIVYNLQNEIVIERKMSLDEICINFTKGRKRFEREFERAISAGAKIHLIIEQGSYEKIIAEEYRSMLTGNSLLSSLIAFCDRYNITVHFCSPEVMPVLIKKLFYHHIRNKLLKELAQ